MVNQRFGKCFVVTFGVAALSGCFGSNEQVEVTKSYWEALETLDLDTLQTLMSDPKDIKNYEHVSGIRLTSKDYDVFEKDGKVITVFRRHCYDDTHIEMPLVEVDGQYKVNDSATQKQQFKAFMKAKKNKTYCYDFNQDNLAGTLNGNPWQFEQYSSRTINWGDGKTSRSITLYAEKCDANTAGACKKESLIISNLDFTASGGNLGYKNPVTVHIPPHHNEVVTEGSYRITRQGEDLLLELTLDNKEKHKLTGAVTLPIKDTQL